MELQRMSIQRLIPANCNPRIEFSLEHPQFEKLRRSIETFRFVESIVWNQRTGRVVSDHQRINVAKHFGCTELDVVVADLDEAAEKALNIALNTISGEWDMPKLKDLLVELDRGEPTLR